MKNLICVVVAVMSLAAVGCKKKNGADCTKAIDNSMALAKADMQKMPGVDDKMMAKMRDIGLQHCKDDKWSDEAVKCMSDAKTEADAQTCYGKMTPDQQQKMNAAVMQLANPAGANAGDSTGSAMGNAGRAAPTDTTGSAAATDTSGSATSATAGSASAPGAGSAASPK